jgi:hypothetical protein
MTGYGNFSDLSQCSGMSAVGESGRVIVEEHFGFWTLNRRSRGRNLALQRNPDLFVANPLCCHRLPG